MQLVQQQKSKLPFYLYAYCLMPNHVHLLIEMQDDLVSRRFWLQLRRRWPEGEEDREWGHDYLRL